MPRFLAVYLMHPDNVVRFRQMTKEEQDAVDNKGVPEWADWLERRKDSILDHGGMVGKNMRVDKTGAHPISNSICGYIVVQADTVEAAAELFDDHPHFRTFPGDSVEIMPFVTEPN